MNEVIKLLILLLLNLHNSNGGKRYPCWPDEFKWSYTGTLEDKGYQCLHVIEVAEPWHHFWYDNYLCAKSGAQFYDIEWEWSQIGPIANMKCVNIYENSSPNFWYDNYLCVPSDSPYNFVWSSAGCKKAKYCIQINEPGAPLSHTWYDNLLCNAEMDNCDYTNVQTAVANVQCSSSKTMVGNWMMILSFVLLFCNY